MKNQITITLAAATLLALSAVPVLAELTKSEVNLSKQPEVMQDHINTVSDGLRALYRRVDELERKVAGMQKQITILHAKKADK